MNPHDQHLYNVIIIVGPTASGKTGGSLYLSQHFSLEIINADMGQFYAPLAVGTAKPEWKNQATTHHLFDIIDQPIDVNVCTYRSLVLEKAKAIAATGKVPCLVGGSLFYIKSLFFPPQDIPSVLPSEAQSIDPTQSLWSQLDAVDPIRAKQIHQNDHYRLGRALELWKRTGRRPSECQPLFAPPFKACVIYIDRPLDLLEATIRERTIQMLESGWIEEAERLMGTEWEPFLNIKKLIGYPEIFQWIHNGKPAKEFPLLINTIQQKTRQYALRQNLFWKTFKSQLQIASEASSADVTIIQTAAFDQSLLAAVCNFINHP